MATQSRSIRRGLPRVEGGDPWPPAGEAPARIVTAETAALSAFESGAEPATAAPAAAPAATTAPAAAPETAPGTTAVSAPVPAVNSGAAAPRQLRRGLPRVPGGEPWPPAGQAPVSAAALSGAPATGTTPTPTATAAACYGRRRSCNSARSAGSVAASGCSRRRTRHPDDGNHPAPARASPRPRR